MKRVIAVFVVITMVLSLSISTDIQHTGTQLNSVAMLEIIGSGMDVACGLALAGLVVATVGLAAATGGIGAFWIGYVGTKVATAGAVASCV
jgi:hypothetical protein